MTLLRVGKQLVDVDEALRELDRLDCEESLAHYLKFFWKFIDPAPYKHGWVVDALCEHLEAVVDGEIRHTIFNVPPRTLKPVRSDAWVPTRESGLIQLKDVRLGMHVLTHRGRFRAVTKIGAQGTLPVLRITTRRGHTVHAAADHPFLTVEGWRALEKIQPQDVVGLVAQYESSGTPGISTEEARLLGYLVGDGNCKGTPSITLADDLEAADIHHVIIASGFESSERFYHMAETGSRLRVVTIRAKNGQSFVARAGRPKGAKGTFGPVRQFMLKHALWGKSSYTKLIPEAVMRGNEEIVRNFIGAYWACDGTIYSRGSKRDGTARDDIVVRCDSVSRPFLAQLQVLLLRIGICSRLRSKTVKLKTKKQGDFYTSYSLEIADQDNAWKFATAIKIFHAKGLKLEKARKRRFDFDRILCGDVVESIEADGNGECICLSVEEDHSFVANGFAVHNSSLCSVAFSSWVWAQRYRSHTSGPGVKFLYASYADRLSLRDSVRCRRVIESEPYQRLWGDRFQLTTDQNTKHRFTNSVGGERLVTSIGASATGDGGDIIVIDDPNAADEMESEATIESTLEWWTGTMPTRLNDQEKSVYIVVQQRLAENDLTGEILTTEAADWTHVMIPMRYDWERHSVTNIGWNDPRGLDENDEPLVTVDETGGRQPRDADAREELKDRQGMLMWPERFGPEALEKLEKRLGVWRTAGQMQQAPSPKGGGIIKREFWKTWAEDAFPPLSYIIASLDTAYTEKTENDPSAMTVWGVFSQDTVAQAQTVGRGVTERSYAQQTPKVILMDAWADRLEIHKLVTKVAATCKKFKVDKLLIESKASGISVAQEIRRLYNHELWAVQLIDPKSQDKVARTHSVAPLWEAGLIWAPDKEYAEETITEMASFPKGKHDDRHDTATMALRHLRDLGLLQLAQEIQAEAQEEMRYQPQPKPLYPA